MVCSLSTLSSERSDFYFVGWGEYLGQYLNVSVVNDAIAGRSARSYTEEGRFDTLIDTVQCGDYVIIEFGHNDGSSGTTDNGRVNCPVSRTRVSFDS